MYKEEDKTITPSVHVPLPELEMVLPIESYRKIMAYAKAAIDIEITGFANVEYNKEKGQLIVGEVFLIDQEAGGADVEISEEDIAKFNLQMIKKGVKQLPRLWWHSHVKMDAFLSGPDEQQTREFQNDTYNVSLVVNQKGEMKAKMYIHAASLIEAMGEQFEQETWIEIDPLPVRIMVEWDEIPKVIVDEVKDKLHDRTGIFGGWLGRGKRDNRDRRDDRREEEDEVDDKVTRKKKHRKGEKPDSGEIVDLEDLHDSYTKDPDVRVLRLPRDPKEAKRKVIEEDLGRTYNNVGLEWVWQKNSEKEPTVIYIDFWEVIEWSWGKYHGDK